MSTTVNCTYCRLPIPSDSKYCPKCGKKLSGGDESGERSVPEKIVCRECGTTNDGANAFCYGCGSALDASRHAPDARGEHHEKAQKKNKNRKDHSNTILIVVVLFALAVIASIILEVRNSGVSETKSVQNQPAEEQAPSGALADPTILQDITALENELKSDPKNSDVLLHLANRLHDAKFYIRAIDIYKKFLALKPSNADARVDLGICYFESGDTKTAVSEIEHALTIDPKHQMAMFNLGIIQLDAGNVGEATRWFKQCMEIDPTSIVGKKAKDLLQQHTMK
ncbi:MAG: tetratricopeptide repeat protein [Bacteroidota bacterium]|jgi:tetratricopeptide (TPR) repeat protein